MTCGEDAYLVHGRTLGKALVHMRPEIDACFDVLLQPTLSIVPLNVD